MDSLKNAKGTSLALQDINIKWSELYKNYYFQDVYSKIIIDKSIITTEYLKEDINQAFITWQNSIFKDSIDYKTFQQYILPYRIRNGYIIENWRRYFIDHFEEYYNKYNSAFETVDSTMNLVNDYQVDWQPISNYPFLTLSDYNMAKMSKCPERCWFNAMLFRSLGLPCTIDFVPAWGNRNHGHEWNAIIMNGKTYPFESTGGNGKWKPKQVYNNEWIDEYWMKSRLPKVFRYTYEINSEGPDVRDAPILFKQRNYIDVSSEYFKTTDVTITNKYVKSTKHKHAYLCVFNEDRWKPVYWGKEIKRGSFEFKNMGRNIAYLPVLYENGNIRPINDAFIIDSLGNSQVFQPDTYLTEKISVTRKYLTRPDLDFWKKWNISSYFEIATKKNFKNASEIFEVENIEMRPTTWSLEEPVYTRFLRYTFSENYQSIAELYFYSKDENGELFRINDKIVFSESELDSNEVNKLFDDNILSYASFSVPEEKEKPLRIGFDFGQKVRLDALGICPRNDKNNIIKGLEYELYYWNNKWISLERKTAIEYNLIFDNVPRNALLLLKCTTEGNENRIFTWDNNNQVWW